MMSRSTCAREICSAWARPPLASPCWYCVLPQMHLPLWGLPWVHCTPQEIGEFTVPFIEGVQTAHSSPSVSQQTSLA